jgi:hypothetical protein
VASIVNVVNKFANQQMVVWQKVGSDPYGKPIYQTILNDDKNSPTQLAVRWEDKQQEIILPGGRVVRSMAYILGTVYIAPGSLVFLGTLADWQAIPTYPLPPTVLQGGREVLKTNTTPDIKAQNYIYESYV